MKTLNYYSCYWYLYKKSSDFKDFFYNPNTQFKDMEEYIETSIKTYGLEPYDAYLIDYEDRDSKSKKTAIQVFIEILEKLIDEKVLISLLSDKPPTTINLNLLKESYLFEKNLFLDCKEKDNLIADIAKTIEKEITQTIGQGRLLLKKKPKQTIY